MGACVQGIAAALVALGLCACASHRAARGQALPAAASAAARASAAEFSAREEEALQTLSSTDPRLAIRMRVKPNAEELHRSAMSAIVAGDESVAMLAGVTDIFSFDVRARRIAEARQSLGRTPGNALPDASVRRPALEVELLGRLVAEEETRVAEERRLPRSASELVRGAVLTWRAPSSMSELHERDGWVARRLDEVRATLGRSPLRRVEITELDDALDDLERLADPAAFSSAHASIARLRIALTGAEATAVRPDAAAFERGLRAHLGVVMDAATLGAKLGTLESELRAEVKDRLSRLSDVDARAARAAAEARVVVTRECALGGDGSRVLAFAASPERAPLCAALRSVAEARSDAETLAAVMALHDDVTLAMWSLDVFVEGKEPDLAAGLHRLLAPIPPEREARLLRLAATRPLLPLGVALMAEWVGREGVAARVARASRWIAFGDAPMDVIERELVN